ncbi:MAG: purine-nucleoside phosphorylase [Sulfolobales archaeon]|nr:purine-nucleoside phosphorylase [Sulfolobales archaeon]MCX8186750.1 purine-nucleoside phosphorylase [Sulfolobales archaeon]MDW7969677.1 purine-nucleoside phosphorylase [Sulfolobales archaeon]
MNPVIIRAKKGEIAERVVIGGDPARIEQLASLLEDPKLVNSNRGLLTYTGTYKGVPVTVATHGIGGPSSAIVVEELIMLGAKVLIRFGTCGAMVSGLGIGDIVIPTGAAYNQGGLLYQYLKENICMAASPNYEVLNSIVNEAVKSGVKFVVGPVVSSDAFYAEDPEFVKKWTGRGIIAVEMECATLFALSSMRKVKSGSLLLVSDSLVEHLGFATAEELRSYVERASKIALNSLINVSIS